MLFDRTTLMEAMTHVFEKIEYDEYDFEEAFDSDTAYDITSFIVDEVADDIDGENLRFSHWNGDGDVVVSYDNEGYQYADTLRDYLKNQILVRDTTLTESEREEGNQIIDFMTDKIKDSIKDQSQDTNVIKEHRDLFVECIKDALWVDGKPGVIIATIAENLIKDSNNHFVTLSSEEEGKISYAKEPEFKYNLKKRTKTTLSKYIKKHFNNFFNSIGEDAVISFDENFQKAYASLGLNEETKSKRTEESILEDINAISKAIKKIEKEKGNTIKASEILFNRDVLMRTLVSTLKNSGYNTNYEKLQDIIDYISDNENNHLLSLSSDDSGKVSYAKDSDLQFSTKNRVKLTLKRYIEKYCLPNIGIEINDGLLESFCNNVVGNIDRTKTDLLVKKELILALEKSKNDKIKSNEKVKSDIYLQQKHQGMKKIDVTFEKPKNDITKDDIKGIKNDITKLSTKLETEAVEYTDNPINVSEESKGVITAYAEEYKLNEERHVLLRAMKAASRRWIGDTNAKINNIIKNIEMDTRDQFLSLSQDDVGKVSYAKTPDVKFNSNHRTKTTLDKYILKHISKSLSGSVMRTFANEVFTQLNNNDVTEHRATELRKPIAVSFEDVISNDYLTTTEYRHYKDKKIKVMETTFYDETKKKIYRERSYIEGNLYRETAYYEDGHIKSIMYYSNGKLNDPDVPAISHYDINGNLLEECFYLQGVLTIIAKYEVGTNKKTITFHNVKTTSAADIYMTKKVYNGDMVTEQHYINGASYSFIYRDDNSLHQSIWIKGEEKTIRAYSSEGNILSWSNYKNNNLQDTDSAPAITEYSTDDGSIVREVFFNDGVCTRSVGYENSVKRRATVCSFGTDNKKTGSITTYYDEKGSIARVSYYNNAGSLHSEKGTPTVINYVDGKIRSTSFYTNGELYDETEVLRYIEPKNEGVGGNLTLNAGNGLLFGGRDAVDEGEKLYYNKGDEFVFVDDDYVDDHPVAEDYGYVTEVTKEEEKPPTKLDIFKFEAKSAGYRVAANQISKGVRGAIVALMQSKGMNDTKLKHVESVLDSEIGLAIISTMMGYSLTYSKYHDDDRVRDIAKEFRVEGISTAGNAVIDEVMEYLVPVIRDAISNVPEEKIRIESGKEKESEEDMVEFVEVTNDSNDQQEVL